MRQDPVTWRALRQQVADIKAASQAVLQGSMDMNDVLHARGKIQSLDSLIGNIEKIATEELEENNE